MPRLVERTNRKDSWHSTPLSVLITLNGVAWHLLTLRAPILKPVHRIERCLLRGGVFCDEGIVAGAEFPVFVRRETQLQTQADVVGINRVAEGVEGVRPGVGVVDEERA